ncbi:extracellular solute-binding protein [Paenibacillus sp. WQ 127069]|uniref:Extracellular solute-binding protein n=1 Tax=Paenibacillus baimaensis TaxID=2982185 RepID=A0ABT2UK88_9BACL|nr:extracellular solute-binding protein [Paenibacillus sp. WQ 127069]MCU6794541.1 extracellular solute-binding protein [Paenibacillus sp. WQ 127069]
MNNYVNRKWMGALSIIVLGSTLAACTGGISGETGKNPEPGKGEAPSASSKPVTLKAFETDINNPIPPGNSMSIPTIAYLGNKTNTILDVTFLSHGKYNEQLRLKMAAGEYPDFYWTGGFANEETLANGMVLPLNELIDKHGPNLKKVIPQSAWDAVTLKGQIMAIPRFSGGGTDTDRLIYVRKDYLDKVGAKIPSTSDEFLDMLRLLRDKDPDGNGKDDTIPFSGRQSFGWMENIFGMWGVDPSANILYNNEIIPGYLHPNMKPALEFIRTMYKEKLLDQEFLSNTGSIFTQKLNSGQAASYNHTVEQIADFQKAIQDANKNHKVDVVAIPTPKGKGYTGPVGNRKYPFGVSTIVMKTTKHPVEVIKLFDWIASEEGQVYVDIGTEGDTYRKEGDKYIYDSANDKNKANLRSVFAVTPLYFNKQTIQARYSPEAMKRIDQAYEIARKEGLPNPTVAMPKPKALSENPELSWYSSSMIQETMTKIVYGELPVDYFDTFVQDIRKQGGNQLIKEMTEWYNNNKTK